MVRERARAGADKPFPVDGACLSPDNSGVGTVKLEITDVKSAATVEGNCQWTFVKAHAGDQFGIGEGFPAPGLGLELDEKEVAAKYALDGESFDL